MLNGLEVVDLVVEVYYYILFSSYECIPLIELEIARLVLGWHFYALLRVDLALFPLIE